MYRISSNKELHSTPCEWFLPTLQQWRLDWDSNYAQFPIYFSYAVKLQFLCQFAVHPVSGSGQAENPHRESQSSSAPPSQSLSPGSQCSGAHFRLTTTANFVILPLIKNAAVALRPGVRLACKVFCGYSWEFVGPSALKLHCS
ncbi:hypothetical protein GE061_005861 [Apolygus lucorum]|uniref:Uncharacterized protein n=1 Tax=Apolygus lucorum TaxID=248454 RepID=A0A8S9WXJ3_APOLU|nr:hypothetical protein GE061_005861 [Apolygus lucorum]